MFAWLRNLFCIIYDQAGWTTEMNVTGVAEVDAAIPEQVTMLLRQ